jgi:hypothetical protein
MTDTTIGLKITTPAAAATRSNIWIVLLVWIGLFASLAWSGFLFWMVGLIFGIF